MSFDNMPALGQQTLPGASEYADGVIARSKEAVRSVEVAWDLAYGSDFFQRLDVYCGLAPRARPAPVLVFLHGGAWRHGFKEWNGFMAPAITSLPAILVSANYRLAPTAKYPAQIEDVCALYKWVQSHIGDYGGDPRRVFIGGHSAGGHLAAMAVLKGILEGVRGCFALSAPLDLRLAKCEAGGRRQMLIRNFLARDEDDADASPVEHVQDNRIPFFLAWGEFDLPEVREQNARMLELLREEFCKVEVRMLGGCSHFDTHTACVDADSAWLRTVATCMRQWSVG